MCYLCGIKLLNTKRKKMNAQIELILSQQGTKTSKIKQLLDIGLTRKEIAEKMSIGYGFVQNVYAANNFTPTLFSKKFGIEIEAYGIVKSVLRNKLIHAGIMATEATRSSSINDWKITNDSSINGEKSFELVSPPLIGMAGIEQLKIVCSVLKECGALVNKSCGLHVHIDAGNFDLTQIKNIFKNYCIIEGHIDKIMPMSRRGNSNKYCYSIFNNYINKKDALNAITESNSIAEIVEKLGNGRYCKVNGNSYVKHGTIEFRQHSGTIEFEKISNWVFFLANLIDFSKNKLIPLNVKFEYLKKFNQKEVFNYLKSRKM